MVLSTPLSIRRGGGGEAFSFVFIWLVNLFFLPLRPLSEN